MNKKKLILADKRSKALRKINNNTGVEVVDTTKRQVALSFSSSQGVERWFGEEVLAHKAENIRLERLQQNAPLLLDHDPRRQIGVIESVRIGEDNKGRAVVRFGNSEEATRIYTDVLDGIRSNVSVGYKIHDLEIEERDNETDLINITDWEPFEISVVSVPADTTVGVGRSAEEPEAPKKESRAEAPKVKKILDEDEEEVKEKIKAEARARTKEEPEQQPNKIEFIPNDSSRIKELLALGKRFKKRDLAEQYILENRSVADFKNNILDNMERQTKENKINMNTELGLSNKEIKNFSFLKSIRALADPTNRKLQEDAAFEFEVSREASKKFNRMTQGVFVPPEILHSRQMKATQATAGQELVKTDLLMQSFIEVLRDKSVILPRASMLYDLIGNIDIPEQTDETKASWTATEGADVASSGMKLKTKSMSPRNLGAYTDITRRLLLQTSNSVENLVRQDLAHSVASAIDTATFAGTGTNGQPTGIINTAGINTATMKVAGKPTYEELVDMETAINTENADVSSLYYITNSGIIGHAKKTVKLANTTATPIYDMNNTINTYNVLKTNKIKTKSVIFGALSEILIGLWSGLELKVDPYSNILSGGVRVVALQDIDVLLRYAKAFSYLKEK